MAYYKVSVDVSDLFDDMLVQAQKSFLIDKFCSLATDQQIEVVSEMLENLNGDQTAKVIEKAIDACKKHHVAMGYDKLPKVIKEFEL